MFCNDRLLAAAWLQPACVNGLTPHSMLPLYLCLYLIDQTEFIGSTKPIIFYKYSRINLIYQLFRCIQNILVDWSADSPSVIMNK